MKKQLTFAFCCLVSIAPLIYLALIWQKMPGTVPTHFDGEGNPNGFSSKGTLWIINGFLAALNIGVYLLLTNLHRIDPKQSGKEPSGTFSKMAVGMTIFMSAINLITILASNNTIPINKVLYPVIGLLFAFLGNIMYSIKPNYFAGFKLPWTLADDGNWRATHRLAGWLWFFGGIGLAICGLVLPTGYISTIMSVLLLVMVGIPVGYSFLYFKRHQVSQ
jgi:uncharacterized membrane protein